ncbi:MAG: hypothetical protein CMG39_00005, partial [Candidatus Marinimicrobia bacterium]|nr:hypothetical protein [Candidatus Neomarinimicrobiota bacterium]
KGISSNPNLTIEMLSKYPEKDWSWAAISKNPNLSLEMITKYRNKEWDRDAISCHSNFRFRIFSYLYLKYFQYKKIMLTNMKKTTKN